MDYRILGETLPAVEVRLQTGEAMYTQSGGMEMCIRDRCWTMRRL